MRIVTANVCPPIPTRNFDWIAYDDDAYDRCGDPTCSCQDSTGNMTGSGATEQEALDDLMEKLAGLTEGKNGDE